jgi:RNA polymerase sigma factor (sigma-70 family)
MSTDEAVSREAINRVTESESPRIDEQSTQFEGLLRNHHSELVRHVYSHVHSWPDAKDIVQQTYFNLFRARGLSAIRHLRAYLFKTAGNLAHDWNRKRLVREAYAREEPLRAPMQAMSPEEICLGREELECLLRQIDTLPQQCRAALLLVRYQGLSFEEAGLQLGIKPKSVRRLCQRAMDYLLETVSQESLTPRGRP